MNERRTIFYEFISSSSYRINFLVVLLGYGESLFTDCKNASLLTHMMDGDMYVIFNIKDDTVSMVKLPEEQTEDELEEYLFISNMAINGFEIQDILKRLTSNKEEYPYVEVFCNIDKEPERYYSSSWRNCRKGYPFKMFKN